MGFFFLLERKVAKWHTEGDAEVAEGAAGDWHVDGELGIAEGREECAEAGNGVGKNDSRTGVETAGATGGNEDTRADHAAEAKPHKIEPAKVSLHVGTGAGPGPAHLLEGGRNGAGPPGEASGGLSQGSGIGCEARERGGTMGVHGSSLQRDEDEIMREE